MMQLVKCTAAYCYACHKESGRQWVMVHIAHLEQEYRAPKGSVKVSRASRPWQESIRLRSCAWQLMVRNVHKTGSTSARFVKCSSMGVRHHDVAALKGPSGRRMPCHMRRQAEQEYSHMRRRAACGGTVMVVGLALSNMQVQPGVWHPSGHRKAQACVWQCAGSHALKTRKLLMTMSRTRPRVPLSNVSNGLENSLVHGGAGLKSWQTRCQWVHADVLAMRALRHCG